MLEKKESVENEVEQEKPTSKSDESARLPTFDVSSIQAEQTDISDISIDETQELPTFTPFSESSSETSEIDAESISISSEETAIEFSEPESPIIETFRGDFEAAEGTTFELAEDIKITTLDETLEKMTPEEREEFLAKMYEPINFDFSEVTFSFTKDTAGIFDQFHKNADAIFSTDLITDFLSKATQAMSSSTEYISDARERLDNFQDILDYYEPLQSSSLDIFLKAIARITEESIAEEDDKKEKKKEDSYGVFTPETDAEEITKKIENMLDKLGVEFKVVDTSHFEFMQEGSINFNISVEELIRIAQEYSGDEVIPGEKPLSTIIALDDEN